MSNRVDIITIRTAAGSETLLPGRSITDIIVAHPTDPNIINVTFGGLESITPDTPGLVFRGISTDGGISWNWEKTYHLTFQTFQLAPYRLTLI
jgi:hypothetical protein